MSRDTKLLIASIVATFLFGIYGALSSHDGGKIILFLPLVSILLIFLLVWHLLSETESRLLQSLARRLPALEHLESREQVEKELLDLASTANSFIVATGGRSREKKYLSAIYNKVSSSDILYWRILLGEEISHELCEHICSLLSNPNVTIYHLETSDLGNILTADSGLLIALPVPGHGGLMGIKVPHPDVAQRVFRYLMLVSQQAKKITTPNEVKSLCSQCKNANPNKNFSSLY